MKPTALFAFVLAAQLWSDGRHVRKVNAMTHPPLG